MRTRRWLARGLAALLVATVLVACTTEPEKKDESAEPSVPPTGPCTVESERGDVVHTVTVDGKKRSYLLYAPEDLPTDERLPVVFLLHGLGQEPADAVEYTGLDQAAADEGFIVVAPRGGEEGPGWAVGTGGQSDDAKFIAALNEAVVERHCADPEREYAVGMSNGSALAFELACTGDFPFAAYGGVAYLTYDGCESAPPTSFIYFHGTADAVVPYGGGDTPIGKFEPVVESLTNWLGHDQCGDPQAYEEPAADLQHFTWSCPSSTVETYVVLGGGHTWPGSEGVGGQGYTTESVSATAEILRFFDLVRDD